MLLQDNQKWEQSFSLDFSDAEAEGYLRDFLKEHPRKLHEMVAGDPMAATRCFHWTVKLVLRALKSSHAPPRRKKRGEYGVGANELTTATSMA